MPSHDLRRIWRTRAPSDPMPLDVDGLDVLGNYLRHAPHPSDPYHRSTPASDSRWLRGHLVEALYLADSEPTAWAEWYRHLAELAIPPLEQMPRDIWTWEVKQTQVADLTTVERLNRVGLSVPTPGRSTWPPFQAIGEELWTAGWPGVLAPSAARPAGRVLCLFHGRWPLSPPTIHYTPPAPPTGMST